MMPRGHLSGVPGGPSSWRMWLAQVTLAACLALSLLLSLSQAKVQATLDGNSSPVDFVDGLVLFGVPLSLQSVWGHPTEARPTNLCQSTEGPWPENNALIRRHNCRLGIPAPRTGCKAAAIRGAGLVLGVPWRRWQRQRQRQQRQRVSVPPVGARDLHVVLLPKPRACPAPAATWTPGHSLALAAGAFLLLRGLGLWAWGWWREAPSVKTQTRQKAQVRVYTHHSDLCAICLERYEEGDWLKILPCSHAYHRGCIDAWLAQAPLRACPLCKRPVASSEDGSDSASESLGDEEPGAPIWAIQEQLRPWAPGPLARATLQPHSSTAALGVPEDTASPPGPQGAS